MKRTLFVVIILSAAAISLPLIGCVGPGGPPPPGGAAIGLAVYGGYHGRPPGGGGHIGRPPGHGRPSAPGHIGRPAHRPGGGGGGRPAHRPGGGRPRR